MAGRPPKDDSMDKEYRVRLNNAENDMLGYCSQEAGEAMSEIFRKDLKAYHENAKYIKSKLAEEEEQYENYGMDHISLKRFITCPYCGAVINMDF